MKQKFRKISKLILICFLAVIAVLVGFAMFAGEQDIALPPILGIFIVIVTVLTLVCIFVAWLLDIVENVKREKLSFLVSYVAVIVVVALVMAVGEYYFGEHIFDIAAWLKKSAFIICAMRAGNYIFSKN